MREHPHIGAALRHKARPQIASAKAEETIFLSRYLPPSRRTRGKLAPCPELDCVRHLLTPGLLAAAELRAAEIGTGADQVLISQNAISDDQYVKALAISLGTGYDSLSRLPRDACYASDLDLIEAGRSGILWLRAGQRRILVVAPLKLAARHIVNSVRLTPGLATDIWLTTPRHLFHFVERHAGTGVARTAIHGLKSAWPEFSANTPRARARMFPAISLATLVAFLHSPVLTANVVNIALALAFLGWTIFRLAGLLAASQSPRINDTTADRDLPVYSIIVALYREAAAVEGLVASLNSLDYPPEKLDIKLVLEPDDDATWNALARLKLGPAFTIVVAPCGGPRTKPKALNSALPYARGSFIAVFDAEDRPEPDQLRQALHAFKAGGDKLACVQARLTIDNASGNWITRMFAAEYAGLFDALLPAIAAWRLPVPLGGTSNHFRTSILRKAGAWDPYNVTEDADLGMRLARLGYHTAVIDSTTYEEAPSRFMPWLRQRTRWFKGWMQTWQVHMRRPMQLWRDLGTPGFLAFQLVVGGTILTAMVHGIFAIALGWHLASGWTWSEQTSAIEILLAGLHMTALVSGYVISGILGFVGLARRRMTSCAWALLLMPIYWLMLSIAAWRAFYQLIAKPHAWEKTEHVLARISRREAPR